MISDIGVSSCVSHFDALFGQISDKFFYAFLKSDWYFFIVVTELAEFIFWTLTPYLKYGSQNCLQFCKFFLNFVVSFTIQKLLSSM